MKGFEGGGSPLLISERIYALSNMRMLLSGKGVWLIKMNVAIVPNVHIILNVVGDAVPSRPLISR